jgi:hypothetical protein
MLAILLDDWMWLQSYGVLMTTLDVWLETGG